MNQNDAGCPQPTPEELEQRWSRWAQAMELSHAMLMAGLEQRLGAGCDLHAAYREWYDKYQALKWNDFIQASPPAESPNAP